jgi:hypothetical protein
MNGWFNSSRKALLTSAMRRLSEGRNNGDFECLVKFQKDENGDVVVYDASLHSAQTNTKKIKDGEEICPICKGTGNDYDAFGECEFPCLNCKDGVSKTNLPDKYDTLRSELARQLYNEFYNGLIKTDYLKLCSENKIKWEQSAENILARLEEYGLYYRETL